MTKKHFTRMAEIVRAIRDGQWTNDLPDWAYAVCRDNDWSPEQRAVHTAEAFIILAREFAPAFDEHKFLVACGLVEAKGKGKR